MFIRMVNKGLHNAVDTTKRKGSNMKSKTLLTVVLCLMMIATVGGTASGVAGTLSSLPGYEDALAAANGTTSGTSPSGTLGSMQGYQDALNNSRVLQGTSPSGTLGNMPGYHDAISQFGGMPGAGSTWYPPLYGFYISNLGGFVVQLACYYSTDDGVTWHESEHINGISLFENVGATLDDLGVPENALVKIHIEVVGGKDRTGSEVFQHLYTYCWEGQHWAWYTIHGTTWNPQLEYDSYYP
jgi:hypothetical protein